MRAIGHNRRAVGDDLVEHIAHLRPSDAANRSVTPRGQDKTRKQAFVFFECARATALPMFGNELCDDILNDGSALPLLLLGRIAPFGGSTQGFGAQLACRFQIENWIGAQRVLARLAAMPIAHSKGPGATWLDDQIKPRQQGVRYLLAHRRGLDGFDGFGGELGHESGALWKDRVPWGNSGVTHIPSLPASGNIQKRPAI